MRIAVTKEPFQNVYVIDTTCFHEYLLFHVITGGQIFYQFRTLIFYYAGN